MIEGADRPLAPLHTRAARVARVTRLGGYTLIEADDPSGVVPRAGQFYMVATVLGWGGGASSRPYLPRALSFATYRAAGEAARLSFLLEVVGPGTERLQKVTVGDELRLNGPFGNGFAATSGEAVLVGGGIGVAPILALFDELIAAGRSDISVLLGFRDLRRAASAELFDGAAVVATDDGSEGHHGPVTELLAPRIAKPGATVYACGPPAMLEAVRALCEDRNAPSQLALESGMACGYGACYGCVVPTRDGYVRLCVDGPVIEGTQIDSVFVGEHVS